MIVATTQGGRGGKRSRWILEESGGFKRNQVALRKNGKGLSRRGGGGGLHKFDCQ